MRLIIYSMIFILTGNSSTGQNNVHQKVLKDIRTCMQYREARLYKKFDIYKTLTEVENYFIQEKILKDTTKESYLNALQKMCINSDSLYYKDIAFRLNKIINNSEWLEDPAVFLAPIRCNYFIIQRDSLSSSRFYGKYFKAALNFDKKGEIDNMRINNRLIQTTPEFDKIEFRAPIIILLYLKINAFKYPFPEQDRVFPNYKKFLK
ncbi:hypothetical protein LA303_06955 [Candidatus Sulfidibacterium hydrothermale]|uniref:hypothetical protein n=1 Tax=Candidatus Sulfidibacterium hydrothermale TaxID=2875962 RepID=UPI001F0A8AAF|nr:hypothetical protein [Candidatus Sulfidibacterium hydrothermale]UBM61165.1 hypothetical protein LA303_06955 [Candidatus Sulfidibacterium hydrothermale]